MSTIVKSDLSTVIANAVYNEILSKTGRYYYFIGKNLKWDSTDTIEYPLDNYSYELGARSNIVEMKQIKASDVAFVIPRYDWESGTVYDNYDDKYSVTNPAFSGATSLKAAKFYVVTNTYNVYKCISNNNNSQSTVRPTLTDTDVFTTADGYVWKFMFNIPIALRNKFNIQNYIPVSNSLKNRFYSNGSITSVVIDNNGAGYTTANITVSGDGYLANNPYILNSVLVTKPGAGYSSAPAITVSAPVVISGSQIQAVAASTISSGSVSGITFSNVGYGYDDTATITIAPPKTGIAWTANTSYTNGATVKYGDNYYTVVGTGTSGALPPTHTTGTVVNGSISLTFSASQAYASIVSTKTEAIMTPVLSGGQIVNVIINDGGVGYTYVTVNVTGNGTEAQISADTSIGNLDTLQSNIELLAVDGAINFVKIENGGGGYTTATVNVTGDGSGFVGTAVITGGKVTGVNITNAGSGYRIANVTISGDGTGATARAIISPRGGHGKNAIEELFASDLMMFSAFSSEKNQGLTVTNDYRQIGIIKNPKTFGDTTYYKNDIGSTCYLLTFGSAINTSYFAIDDILTTQNGKTFSIISINGTQMLVHSALDNAAAAGEQLTNTANGNSLTPLTVVAPTIDRYTGSMLFIDNRNAFVATSEQAVSLRTIISV